MATGFAESTDEVLLDRVRDGDRRAFAVLFERHHARTVHYAHAVTGSRADAEDLSSDALVRMMLALESGKGPETNVAAYLRTTVRRLAIDMGVKNARTVLAGLAIDDTEPSSQTHQLTPIERESILNSAFNSLPPRWRQVLWMVEVLGYRPADLARELDITPPAACSLLWRARTALKNQYCHMADRSKQD
jgi:RNA polymerase sigma factor (sigma-70 family)